MNEFIITVNELIHFFNVSALTYNTTNVDAYNPHKQRLLGC